MLRAIIFDFDGVVVDTEPMNLTAFREVLAAEGPALSENDYYSIYLGLNDATFLRRLFSDQGRPLSEEALSNLLAEKDRVYQARISAGLPRLPGVDDFVRRVAERWPLSICSGAHRVEIETILEHAGLRDLFPIIVSTDEVPESKPSPAGYLRTLELLRETMPDLTPGECLVIEDSLLGISAARDAGMHVLGVQSYHGEEALKQADRSVPDLRAATDAVLLSIFE